jgi:DNA repair protein RecN (Recombination protein N)
MLKQLNINNIILVESAEIAFQGGFNVLSGETGSGKSAVMEAINCLMGARADTSIIRRDAGKGAIEASFDIEKLPKIKQLLDASGITHEDGHDLLMKREITATGKSRAFINNQMAQLTLVRQMGELLFQIVGQHANQRLLSSEQHRLILDNFGELENTLDSFSVTWKQETALRKELQELISSESFRLRTMEALQKEMLELDAAKIQEGEEEELFSEYTLLSNSEELGKLSQEVSETLCGEDISVISLLKKIERSLEKIAELDTSQKDTFASFSTAKLELIEIGQTFLHYHSGIEYSPQRIEQINDRMSLINKLKKKYGPSLEDMHVYHDTIGKKLHDLTHSDDRIDALKVQVLELENTNNKLASQITEKRKKTAKDFIQAIENELHALNMPKSKFFIEITPQKRNQFGDDHVDFFLMPNVGEKKISIKDCASGGELSRLMLAIQTLLAGKESIPTLIFDEIDANIGGETANIIGEKLNQIGNKHQVLCITHFAQVAKSASHHIQILKIEKEGRTLTMITPLDKKSRIAEINRMRGEKQ